MAELPGHEFGFTWLVVKTVEAMQAAHARGNIDECFIRFFYALQYLVSFIPPADRARLDEDFQAFNQAVRELSMTSSNDAARDQEIRKLKESFVLEHLFYITNSFSRAGIVKLDAEAELPVSDEDLERVAYLIRHTGGLPSALKNAGKKAGKGESHGALG